MGDRMTPIPFHNLMDWILTEKKESNRVFGVKRPFVKEKNQTLSIFGEKLETPFGPAAGPHTQLAQNIVAAYYTGSRFFELKTVQILDGEDLPVNKPCILAEDEGYNCEWSTELRVPEAFDEYVKGWIALKVIAKEFGLGEADGFVFNMSVGYDLKGIQSEKINTFIDQMMEAKDTPIWKECMEYLSSNLNKFETIDQEFIDQISSSICSSVTVSTLHGCPPQEIESIATYLLKEKHLNTFVKCNPTLLGYETAREIMDQMGYGYVVFGDFHFKDDLQFEDAVPMLQRLQDRAKVEELEFGVKITNTFPVDVTKKELPSEEMYMSGRALCALSLSVAYKLSKAFDGKLRISYSGGADYFNIDKIYSLGIWPVTLATTFLKTGGYQRGNQIAEKLEHMEYQQFSRVSVEKLGEFIEEVKKDPHYTKGLKPMPSRKMTDKKVPLINCFVAPCSERCPINQDIPAYLKLVKEGNYAQALKVITDKNALPFITGTICSHSCMSKCTRNFYEEPIKIRSAKLVAANHGYEELLQGLDPSDKYKDKKVAVVGAGPAGIAAAYFLAREGADVTVFEKRAQAGGVVRYIVPEFRVPSEIVEKDVALAEKMGAKFVFHHPVTDLKELKEEGFENIILAVGAYKKVPLGIECENEINAIEFLDASRNTPEVLNLGKNVAIIGAGNTAMDAARAAKRAAGVENVYIVYRRTVKYMPADEEELELALEDGVELKELLAPVAHKNNKLICHKVVLGEMDASGRQKPVETEEEVILDVDTVVASLGEKVDTDFYKVLGLDVNSRGVQLNPETMEASAGNIYIIGDGAAGPATVVEAIRDASKAVNAILGLSPRNAIVAASTEDEIMNKKGVLTSATEDKDEGERCLECNLICEACTEVCPNRANIAITVPGTKMPQIIHVDYMCNECGNCRSFCPYDSAPYQDKFTLYHTVADFENSKNEGFVLLDKKAKLFRVRLGEITQDVDLKSVYCNLHVDIRNIIQTVYYDYSYLLL